MTQGRIYRDGKLTSQSIAVSDIATLDAVAVSFGLYLVFKARDWL